MVQIEDIKDEVSLKAWLDTQPVEVSPWIAARAALRVFPYYWEWAHNDQGLRGRDLTVLPELRFYLTSAVARRIQTTDVMDTLASNSVGTNTSVLISAGADISVNTSAFASVNASAFASDSARAVAVTSDSAVVSALARASSNASATTLVSDSAIAHFWKSVRQDCYAVKNQDNLEALPLWADGENPLLPEWKPLKAQLSVANASRSADSARGAVDVDWSFWVKWYDDILAGHEPNWDLYKEIALIDDAVSEKGARVVNDAIGEIAVRHELKSKISDLEKQLQSVSIPSRGIGDNHGPTLDDGAIPPDLTFIWADLQGLKQEVEAETPNKSRVLRWAKNLGKIGVEFVKYMARKGDTFVDAAMSAGGKAAGVALVPVVTAYFGTEAPTIAGKIAEVAELAVRWAGYLH
jgi:hypothetical protein